MTEGASRISSPRRGDVQPCPRVGRVKPCYVRRTCVEVSDATVGHAPRSESSPSKPLSDYRHKAAYVLLGDPGFGKTTEFKRETVELGEKALLISARDFIALDAASHLEWEGKFLFIDGLDEVRSGGSDRRIPLDQIRHRLDRLQPQGFRISCREADWLGHNDREHLRRVSPDSAVTVLRLDELGYEQVMLLLQEWHGRNADEAETFIAEAGHRGVDSLLTNPLTLGLLASAVGDGTDWPDGRRATLETACLSLAREHNDEHESAASGASQLDPKVVVDAAGYLCTLQLLADIEGFQLLSSHASPSFPALAELAEPPRSLSTVDLRSTVSTKLFTALGGGFAPLHRQVAEFLAGRYLAKLIHDGLPATRLVALMTASTDGGVVTSLRGLAAWLASHSHEARHLLIKLDPLGVGLYGDISGFPTSAKRQFLESLSGFFEDNPQQYLGFEVGLARFFSPLVVAEMVPELQDVMRSEDHSPSHEKLLEMILKLLAGDWGIHAILGSDLCDTLNQASATGEDRHAHAALRPDLERILLSETCSEANRAFALDAYLKVVDVDEERNWTLRSLLESVQNGSVADPYDQIRGTLLAVLYPHTVQPSEVWRFAVPLSPFHRGRFRDFWEKTLLLRSSPEHLAELLDALHGESANLAKHLKRNALGKIPAKLLAKYLKTNGDIQQDLERLCRWLAIIRDFDRHRATNNPASEVYLWLEHHPGVQKQLFLFWLRNDDPALSQIGPFSYRDALLRSKPPPDFGVWCLEEAIKVVRDEPKLAKCLLRQAHRVLNQPSINHGLTLEVMREKTLKQPILARYLDELSAADLQAMRNLEKEEKEYERLTTETREQWLAEERQTKENWIDHLREQQTELLENRFTPQNLSVLAEVALGLGNGSDRELSPQERLDDFLLGETTLVDAVMTALRGAAWREDIPDAQQTVSLSLESRQSTLAYTVLAGIDLAERDIPGALDGLSVDQKRKILSIYYCVPHSVSATSWHRRWLETEPEMVLEVLFWCVVAELRAGKDFSYGLRVLDNIEGFKDLVNDVRMRLLAAFPTRSSKSQLQHLDSLLSHALEYQDNSTLLALARRKQALNSMPIAQRVRWWTTDALIEGGNRLGVLKSELTKSEVRIRHMAEFLRPMWHRFDRRPSILSTIRDPETLEELIAILGRLGPAPLLGRGIVTLEMDMSDLIEALIQQLASEPGEQAEQPLKRLTADSELAGWRPHLQRALATQQVISRDAQYRHPSIEQIQDTIRDGPPATPADLAALLQDRLENLQSELRYSSSDIWRQFWNEDPRGRTTQQKPENSCRDVLLSHLQSRLPEGIEAVREASHVANTRSDIEVSYLDFKVPVEIKKDSNSDLWTAAHEQLMAKYMTDSAVGAYGVYLVLWFADQFKPATRYRGTERQNRGSPNSPDELKRWLEDDLTTEKSRTIAVIVLDVSSPIG